MNENGAWYIRIFGLVFTGKYLQEVLPGSIENTN